MISTDLLFLYPSYSILFYLLDHNSQFSSEILLSLLLLICMGKYIENLNKNLFLSYHISSLVVIFASDSIYMIFNNR